MCTILNDFVEFAIILINSLFILSNPVQITGFIVQLKAGFTPRNICKKINCCRRQLTNLDMGYLCLMPRPLYGPIYSQLYLDI